MHDYELLDQIYNDEPSTAKAVFKWIAGILIAFAVALLFVFLLLRAVDIESQYTYQWDEEQQRYFKTEEGV